MPEVEIYTTTYCGFSRKAKQLLNQKGIDYKEINIGGSAEKRAEMRNRSDGSNSVPQIFVNGKHLGDCDELYRLEGAGELDEYLGLNRR